MIHEPLMPSRGNNGAPWEASSWRGRIYIQKDFLITTTHNQHTNHTKRNRHPMCRHLQSSNTTTLLPNHDHCRTSHTDTTDSERHKLLPTKLTKPINQHRIAQPTKERTLKPIEQRILHATHTTQATTTHHPSTWNMHMRHHRNPGPGL
jgi:hypothetical protein